MIGVMALKSYLVTKVGNSLGPRIKLTFLYLFIKKGKI